MFKLSPGWLRNARHSPPSRAARALLPLLLVLAACSEMPSEPPPGAEAAPELLMTGGTVDFVAVAGAFSAGKQTTPLFLMNDIAPAQTVLATDYTAAGVGGMRDTGVGTISLSGVSGPVSQALLYWHAVTRTTDPAAGANITVNGARVSGTNIGFSSDNCWGYSNSQAYRADITAMVQALGNATYSLAGFSNLGTVNPNGASLVVFFDDADSSNDRDVVIYDGNDSNINNSYDAPGWNVTLAGINYTTGTASMQMHVADGQIATDDAIVVNSTVLVPRSGIFQGNSVAGPKGNGLWDIKNFGVTSLLTPGPNTLSLTTGVANDCLALVVAIVDLPAGAAPPPPPPANVAPVANAGPDQSVALSGSTTATVALDGSGSSDDGNIQPLSYSWSSGAGTASGVNASLILGIGTHTITLTVDDGQFTDTDEVVITVYDPSPPLIAATVSGTFGTNGWYVSDVGVSWSVTDLESAISTSTGCGATSQTTDSPSETRICEATSAGGTSSEPVTFMRDATDPTVTYSAHAATFTVDETIAITCTAADNLSGLAGDTCADITGPAYTFPLGLNAFSASATDNAGNSGSGSTSFTVQVTSASLCNLVRAFVTHSGVANSLCVKLSAAQRAAERGRDGTHDNIMGSFINEVAAQSGEKIDPAHAAILIALATALIG